ncbi:hypothetical protein QZH41_019207 [Actinostola sp. cb2023]|nr:hypothetical protein QZH41_019207 [Actinostola sp. cb2023]
MATCMNDVEEQCSNLEQIELDGIANAEVYTQLLAIYLLNCDICNAKFLWKRIPDDVKTSCPELSKLWNLGCNMWKRDYQNIYSSLQHDWSPLIQTYIVALKEKLQEKVFNLLGSAYTSIKAEDFVVYMGMSMNEAIEGPLHELIKSKSIELKVKRLITRVANSRQSDYVGNPASATSRVTSTSTSVNAATTTERAAVSAIVIFIHA